MTVTIDYGPRAERFRSELRSWLDAKVPKDRDARRRLAASPDWAHMLLEAGYICVAWPEEFGGRGLGGVEVAAMNEEFRRVRMPRVTRGMGEGLVGPSIIVHGTDEQKAYLLPRIIDGTDRYCQGFSEPDAGSDLASLKTRGIVDGDEVVVTGQKVWTSWYWDATMLFCLCRTDPGAPKHRGISYVLIPIEREDGSDNGVEFRPLRQLTGDSHFAETFLTEARAPMFNVIGGLDNGWRVAMTTLGNERGGNATTQYVQHERELWKFVDEVRKRGKASDPLVRQELAWAYTHVEIMRYAGLRLLSEVMAQREPGPSASINKMFWSEDARRFGEVMMNVIGPDAMLRPDGDGYELDRWQQQSSATARTRSGVAPPRCSATSPASACWDCRRRRLQSGPQGRPRRQSATTTHDAGGYGHGTFGSAEVLSYAHQP